MNMDQWIEKLRDDPETRRRLALALIPWKRPRFVLRELNTWSPRDWEWYWYGYWSGDCADEIPDEYLNRILEEEDI